MESRSDFSSIGSGRFQHIDYVAQTGSTNDDLASVVASTPAQPRVRIADEQVAGRGRRDRTWDMPAGGGLLISFFVPWTDAATAHLVPTCLGVAAVEAALGQGRVISLKWPNDLVDDEDRKLGGMLSSASLHQGDMIGVIAGLGCNVSWPPANNAALPNATCLDRLGGAPVDRVALAVSLIAAFDDALTSLQTRGAQPLHDRYRRSCRTIGQRVRVERSAGDLVGVATDIDPSGALLVTVDATQHRVDVGDLIHLRPAAD